VNFDLNWIESMWGQLTLLSLHIKSVHGMAYCVAKCKLKFAGPGNNEPGDPSNRSMLTTEDIQFRISLEILCAHDIFFLDNRN
jgi:hypothetical protein